MTDDQQQQRLNEAADQFTNALVESFRVVAQRGEEVQQQGAQLTEDFFNRVVTNLQTQAEENRQMTQQLADQQRRQREATQALMQESIGAYAEFADFMFSYYWRNVEEPESSSEE